MAHKPKFKEGDYINFKGCKANYGKIDCINENGYFLKDSTFIHFDNEHLWEGIDEPVVFRNDEGYIICIKEGFIAADINPNWHIKEAKYVGHSMREVNGHQVSYYDIKLDALNEPYIHLFRGVYSDMDMADFKPVIYEKDPF